MAVSEDYCIGTRARSGIVLLSRQKLSFELEICCEKIYSLISKDPESFANAKILSYHIEEVKTQVDLNVDHSLQYCQFIKDQ